jgi:inorganic triphosphatase YgiF
MTEVELKLQVSEAARAGVERSLAESGAVGTRLQAIYFDTVDGRLAAAGLALRLRKEGRRWVQTLKDGSTHGLGRGEHNVAVRAVAGVVPALDASLHAGTPPGDALARVLAPRKGEAGREGPPPLQPRYRADVRRRHRRQRMRRGTVELAFDRGEIFSTDAAGATRRWPVSELEIELVSGSPHAVIDAARRAAARHGLWLDTRSKAERGERLARGLGPQDAAPAVKAASLQLRKSMSPAEAWSAVLRNVLAHALPNWSETAAGAGASESVHQLRVALRRLRSAQRFFDGWHGVPGAAWSDDAAALFRALGEVRDRDVLGSGLQREVDAALAALGEPALPLPAAHTPAWSERERSAHGLVLIDLCREFVADADASPSKVVRTRDAARVRSSRALVRHATDKARATGTSPVPSAACDGATEGAAPSGAQAELDKSGEEVPSLRAVAAQRLQQWHAQVRRDAKRFDALSDEHRHRLRKRLKRLRYAIEFSAGLFPRRAVERYLTRLRPAQERLGEFNDVCVAVAAYRSLASDEPRAWFALGWLAARRTAALAAAADELRRLRKVEPFWD